MRFCEFFSFFFLYIFVENRCFENCVFCRRDSTTTIYLLLEFLSVSDERLEKSFVFLGVEFSKLQEYLKNIAEFG